MAAALSEGSAAWNDKRGITDRFSGLQERTCSIISEEGAEEDDASLATACSFGVMFGVIVEALLSREERCLVEEEEEGEEEAGTSGSWYESYMMETREFGRAICTNLTQRKENMRQRASEREREEIRRVGQ